MKNTVVILFGFITAVLLTAVAQMPLTAVSTAQEPAPNSNAYMPVVAYQPLPTHTPTPTATPSPTPSPTPQPTATPVPTATPEGTMVEMRGLWVSRFDWTSYNQPADPARIDQIVHDAATAGFNTIFFQVRGTADAYYAPGLEPWGSRVSGGELGEAPDPWWDPLERLIDQARQHDIQVHAYLNIYPLWLCNDVPPADTQPQHLYHKLVAEHGTINGVPNGVAQSAYGTVYCDAYQRATPASIFLDDHLMAVADDLMTRYDLDGLHLDHIRYGGRGSSCDPVSVSRFGAPCFEPGYADWQRRQVNGTVRRFFDDVVKDRPGVWLSAAVWPIYQDKWGWGVRSGYEDYYQDSHRWMQDAHIDALTPMIYPANYDNADFWTLSRWETLTADFLAHANGRAVVPGIGGGYADFAEIENRINAARSMGTAGHAIFSYSGLAAHGHFDDLAAGPYAQPAVVPAITWR